MSLEPSLAGVAEALVCEAGCSPSHRRARRLLTGIAVFLMIAILALAAYCLWSNAA